MDSSFDCKTLFPVLPIVIVMNLQDLKLGYKKSDNLLQLLHEQNVSRIPDVFLSVQLATTTTCRIYRRASTEECNPHICEDT